MQAYSSQVRNREAVAQRKKEQKTTGVGVRQRGRCHVGGSSLPTNQPTGSQLLPTHPALSRQPPQQTPAPPNTFTEWTPYTGTCVFSTSRTLDPFSGRFAPYLLSIYLNLTLDVRNTLYSSSHLNHLQHP